jgi:hypothetical protein
MRPRRLLVAFAVVVLGANAVLLYSLFGDNSQLPSKGVVVSLIDVRQVQKHIGVKTQSPDKTTTRDVNPVKENNVVTIHNGPAVENKREGNTPDVVEVAGKKPSISPVAVNEIDIKTVTQAHNLKANAITKQSKTNLKGNESVGPDDVLPVLVLSCDRTSVKRCLDLLIKSVAKSVFVPMNTKYSWG